MEKPLREHFEVETDAGDSLRTFDYIDQLEQYILTLEQQIKKSKIESRNLDKPNINEE